MMLSKKYHKLITIVTVLLFSMGNSGVAAVWTSCSMDNGPMACCQENQPEGACGADMQGSSSASIVSIDYSCFSTRTIGGVSTDEGIVVPEYVIRMMDSSLTPSPLMPPAQEDVRCSQQKFSLIIVHTSSPPPLYLFNSAFLI